MTLKGLNNGQAVPTPGAGETQNVRNQNTDFKPLSHCPYPGAAKGLLYTAKQPSALKTT